MEGAAFAVEQMTRSPSLPLPHSPQIALLSALVVLLMTSALGCTPAAVESPQNQAASSPPTVGPVFTAATSRPLSNPTPTVVLSPSSTATSSPPLPVAAKETPADCPVTLPVPAGAVPEKAAAPIIGGSSRPELMQISMYGNDSIWVTVPPDGVTTGAEHGSGVFEKFGIVDLLAGEMPVVDARRLDGESPSAEIEVTGAWTSGGSLYIAGAFFPKPGCWSITISSGPRHVDITLVIGRLNQTGSAGPPETTEASEECKQTPFASTKPEDPTLLPSPPRGTRIRRGRSGPVSTERTTDGGLRVTGSKCSG